MATKLAPAIFVPPTVSIPKPKIPKPINVYINKKNFGSKITENDIKLLKLNQTELNEIYNLMLIAMCFSKTFENIPVQNVISNIFDEIIKKDLTKFCVGTTLGEEQCTEEKQMFAKTNIEKLIKAMYTDKFLNKACQYHNFGSSNFNIQTHISQHGGNLNHLNHLINIESLLLEPDHDISYMCVKHNNELKCVKHKNGNCDFCQEWKNMRNTFKQMVFDLTSLDDAEKKFNLMSNTVYTLPAVILDQNEYHDFKEKLREYKLVKKEENK